MTRILFPLVFFGSLLFISACGSAGYSGNKAVNVNFDDRVKKIRISDLKGKHLDLTKLAGKPIFLNFWATWCGPCIGEMESMERIYQTYKDDIHFLAVSSEELDKIKGFKGKKDFTFPIARLDMDYLDAYVVKLPTTLLIDRSGKIVFDEEGARDWTSHNSLEKIRQLLK